MPECVLVRWRWACFLLWRVLHPKWQKTVHPASRSSMSNLGTRHSTRLILMGDRPPAAEYLTETKLSPHTAVILLVQLSASHALTTSDPSTSLSWIGGHTVKISARALLSTYHAPQQKNWASLAEVRPE